MKTITFYSFKGGTGRSLALAHIAVLLARFGKSVCVVDFDLESPGLPDKFASLHSGPKAQWGLVDYLQEAPKNGPLPRLDNRLIRFESPNGDGVIHLFPAGDIHGQYFDIISSPGWYDFLLAINTNTRAFFLGLRERIAEDLDPKPDFLLIDARSGVTELGGICTRLLADEVVVLTTDAPDSVDGTNAILRSLELARKTGADAPAEIHTVLSRTPYYYFDEHGTLHWLEDDQRAVIRTEVLNTINYGLEHRLGPLHSFSLEPRLSLEEHLLIKFTGSAESSPLAKDYIDFCGLFLDKKEELASLLGEVRTYRPYLLIEETGKMINPQDNSWNVAFRVDTLTKTFSSLYDSIYTTVLKDSGSEDVSRKAAWTALANAGLRAAEEFSGYLRDLWSAESKHRGARRPYKDLLNDWCRFDSTVGFGRFENETWSGGLQGEIILIDNFLLFGRPLPDTDLCAFMVGYIQRVLSAIFDVELGAVSVEHELQRDCGARHAEGGPAEVSRCVFPYAILPLTSGEVGG
jgi:MinD-like ATPase involved in chromosome partitioning or flagellar assembly